MRSFVWVSTSLYMQKGKKSKHFLNICENPFTKVICEQSRLYSKFGAVFPVFMRRHLAIDLRSPLSQMCFLGLFMPRELCIGTKPAPL